MDTSNMLVMGVILLQILDLVKSIIFRVHKSSCLGGTLEMQAVDPPTPPPQRPGRAGRRRRRRRERRAGTSDDCSEPPSPTGPNLTEIAIAAAGRGF